MATASLRVVFVLLLQHTSVYLTIFQRMFVYVQSVSSLSYSQSHLCSAASYLFTLCCEWSSCLLNIVHFIRWKYESLFCLLIVNLFPKLVQHVKTDKTAVRIMRNSDVYDQVLSGSGKVRKMSDDVIHAQLTKTN